MADLFQDFVDPAAQGLRLPNRTPRRHGVALKAKVDHDAVKGVVTPAERRAMKTERGQRITAHRSRRFRRKPRAFMKRSGEQPQDFEKHQTISKSWGIRWRTGGRSNNETK